jgi:hypothetical protein
MLRYNIICYIKIQQSDKLSYQSRGYEKRKGGCQYGVHMCHSVLLPPKQALPTIIHLPVSSKRTSTSLFPVRQLPAIPNRDAVHKKREGT